MFMDEIIWCVVWCGLVAKSCPTLATPWTANCQAPLSMGFSGQEYWRGLPFPSPGDLPNPGIEPWSPALHADFLPTELWGKPMMCGICFRIIQWQGEGQEWVELQMKDFPNELIVIEAGWWILVGSLYYSTFVCSIIKRKKLISWKHILKAVSMYNVWEVIAYIPPLLHSGKERLITPLGQGNGMGFMLQKMLRLLSFKSYG